MPNWKEVLDEIQKEGTQPEKAGPAIDKVRRKYLLELSKYTKRNVVAYYSGWLQKPNNALAFVNDKDISGLMLTFNQLDKSKGLDIILHTPGGDVAATEAVVKYIKSIFGNDVRAIVPQIAMSAGTMIALSTCEIIMGKHSSLGPIDPQIGGIPAEAVINEFNLAKKEIMANPRAAGYWQFILQKYHPTFLSACKQAIDMSKSLAIEWLAENMCKGNAPLIRKIVKHFTNHKVTKIHARHIMIETCTGLGMKITPLEHDQLLQDLVLTAHHTFMHTFSRSPAIKIIENQNGSAYIENLAQLQMPQLAFHAGQPLPINIVQ